MGAKLEPLSIQDCREEGSQYGWTNENCTEALNFIQNSRVEHFLSVLGVKQSNFNISSFIMTTDFHTDAILEMDKFKVPYFSFFHEPGYY